MYKSIKSIHIKKERMNNMDENIELLEYIYKNAEMGVHSLTKLQEELESYEHFKKESKKLIKKNGYDLEKNKLTAKIASSMGIKKEVNSDNSDASIAHMLTQGITMGVVDMETKIDNYKEVVNEDILSLAKEFLKFQQEEIEKLKEYM